MAVMQAMAIGFSVVATLTACIAVIVAVLSLIHVEAFKRSTHQIQYVPADDFMRQDPAQQMSKIESDQIEAMEKGEPWKDEEAI